jgi:hypothetical protein
MHRHYNEEQRQQAMEQYFNELVTLEYEQQEVKCLGKELKEKHDRTGTRGKLEKLWKQLSGARDSLYLVDCSSWLCPGIAACAAVLLKWLLK